MKYIKTPTDNVFKFDDCTIFDDDLCTGVGVFLNTENQKELADELFKQTGILVADMKGGENKNG